MKHARADAGNILFIILLGIVLFAAFSLAVTQGSRNAGSGNPDQVKIDASQILQYGTTLKEAVQLLRNQGVSESEISFANGTVAGYGTIDTAPTKEVFNIKGGGIVYETPLSRWSDGISTAQTGYGHWYFSGRTWVRQVGTPKGATLNATALCTDATCVDLLAVMPYLKKETCLQINKNLGVNSIPQDNGGSIDFSTNKFNGTYDAGSSSYAIGDNPASILVDRSALCYEGGGGGVGPAAGTYHFYQVLIAR